MHVQRWFAAIAFVSVVVTGSGCAGYRVQRDGEGPGYDVYGPDPYLLGTPKVVQADPADPKSLTVLVYDFQVIWLPNQGRRYRVSSWAGLGKANFKFAFADGWKLTQIDDGADNSQILQEVMGLVKHVLPADPWQLARKDGGSSLTAEEARAAAQQLQPVLYALEYDNVTGSVRNLRKVDIGSARFVGPVACPPGLAPGVRISSGR